QDLDSALVSSGHTLRFGLAPALSGPQGSDAGGEDVRDDRTMRFIRKLPNGCCQVWRSGRQSSEECGCGAEARSNAPITRCAPSISHKARNRCSGWRGDETSDGGLPILFPGADRDASQDELAKDLGTT